MDTIEKVYCTVHDNNDALVSALASKNNCDPMAMAAMMNQNDYMNNPFAYLIWMIFAMRMWNNQDGNQGNAIQSQLDAMRSQIADNQNSSLVMDAIRGNANVITQLASKRTQLTRCRQVSATQMQVWRELQVTLVSR